MPPTTDPMDAAERLKTRALSGLYPDALAPGAWLAPLTVIVAVTVALLGCAWWGAP